MQDEQRHIDVDAEETSGAVKTFLTWATPRSAVRLVYTPDVLLGIDTEGKRGFLLDEVYSTTIWADRDADALVLLLGERLEPSSFRESAAAERDPLALLRVAVDKGEPLPPMSA